MQIAVIHLLENQDDKSELNNQYELLANLTKDKKHICIESQEINEELLKQQDLVMLVSPRRNLIDKEPDLLNEFLISGGGVLITMGDNHNIDIDELPEIKNLINRAGVKIRENYNDTPDTLTSFFPHFITANIKELDYTESGYYLEPQSSSTICSNLASSHDPELLMMAASNIENGRLVIISNSHIFTKNEEANETTDNELFINNLVIWLASNNPFDLTTVNIPKSIPWESSATVKIGLIGNNKSPLSSPICILDSKEPTMIEHPRQAIYGLSEDETIYKEWSVRPKNIGNHKLILDIKPDENSNEKYRYYLPLPCTAEGIFNLQTKNEKGEICNNFMTNEIITISGLFQWSTQTPPKPLELELIHGKELITVDDEVLLDTTIGVYQDHAKQWKLKAVEVGCHEIQLKLMQSDQTHTHFVKVNISNEDKMAELNALYVVPLEAEIAGRLKLIDKRLATDEITASQVRIVTPNQYIHQIYFDTDTREWLNELINSAWRENYKNNKLISLITGHFLPTYTPGVGALIPCDPQLASKLIERNPRKRILINHALLYSSESSPLEVKQNLISFITHEKFGHGFVSTQTLLGQQIVTLEKYADDICGQHKEYADISNIILDSSILIEEGFAAWLEIHLLENMPTDIMQSVYIRKNMLFNPSESFIELCEESKFFSDFPSRYKSRYLEVYEYLEILAINFSTQCAIDAFIFATDIDYGIRDTEEGIIFAKSPDKLRQMIKIGNETSGDSIGHKRLEMITEYLNSNIDATCKLVRSNNYVYNFNTPSLLEELFKKALLNN